MHESNEATATMPAPGRDILTEILHDGAQRLLTQAIDAEVADWIDRHAEVVGDNGRRQVVRNGHHPTQYCPGSVYLGPANRNVGRRQRVAGEESARAWACWARSARTSTAACVDAHTGAGD